MIKIRTSIRYLFWSLLTFFISVMQAGATTDTFECKSASPDFTRCCPPYSEYLADGKGGNCLLCSIYEVIMDACARVVTLSWNAFAGPLQGVIVVGASIYIAVYTLRNLASFSQQDSSAYLSNDKTGIIPLGVKTAAVVWLLGNESFLYSHLIGPVIGTGLMIGQQISPGGLGGGFGSTNDVGSLFDAVISQVRSFNDNVYAIVAMGRMLLCLSFLPDGIINWYWSLVPFGALLYVFGWFILIGVSFYLLDVLFRLAVGCMLLPMAIACGFSKFTSSYTKSAWNLFVNVFFNFVMLGVLLTFTTKMIDMSVTGNSEMEGKLTEKIILNKADIEAIVKNLSVMSFILTTICCMVAFKLFMEIEELADNVSSAKSVGKLGKQAGGIVGSTAKAVVSKPMQQMGKIANAARLETGKTISDSKTGMRIRRAGQSFRRTVKKAVGLK